MVKMVALRDYLDPYNNVMHNVNSGPFEHPDEKLCEFLEEMGTLAYAPDEPELVVEAPKKTTEKSDTSVKPS